jgi:hypothetical protein
MDFYKHLKMHTLLKEKHLNWTQIRVETSCANKVKKKSYCLSYWWLCLQKLFIRKKVTALRTRYKAKEAKIRKYKYMFAVLTPNRFLVS